MGLRAAFPPFTQGPVNSPSAFSGQALPCLIDVYHLEAP